MTVELTLLTRVSFRGRELTGARPGSLLALLAGSLRTGCGAERLIAGLWPGERPEHPAKAVQILVSRTRARLGPDVIVNTPTGYRLALAEEQVDTSAVLLHAAASEQAARAGDHAGALEHADAGLMLYNGPAYDGPADTALDDPLSALRAARATTYRSLTRSRALALARLGRYAEAAVPLGEARQDRPADEEVLLELLRCEASTTSPAAALNRYEDYRRALRDDLGSDPGPALRALHRELLLGDAPAQRHGVHHEPNPLLGRERDIAAVTALLRTSRVVSIAGPGGLGKTRLAHAVSRQADQRVVHFIELAALTADSDVAAAVAAEFGVSGTTALADVVEAIGTDPVLLVLDNCEHVVRGAADLAHGLVSLSGDLRVLTTSRAPLGVSSEAVYALPELDLPTAAELFTQRARAARPGADLPAEAVRNLCERLDGLPLAVELAAARIRVLSVAEIAGRLADRFTVLRGATRDAPDRHRTLHAVIDWSWHLLDDSGQAAMRTLSVFPDGFTADAARRLLGDDGVLEQLVDQSLLKPADATAGTRFRMLETVREFSGARRDEIDGETDRVIGAFLSWARDFGMSHHDSVVGPDLVQAVGRIRVEEDNLALALHHGLDREDGAAVAAIAAVLGSLWVTESNFTRLTALAEETAWLLSHYRPAPGLLEATRTAAVLGALISLLMRTASARRTLVTLRRLPAASPDDPVRAIQAALCAPDDAALQRLCDSDRPILAGMACYIASYVRESANDLDGALRAARRMLARLEHDGTPLPVALAHARVGELCLQVDPGDEALRHIDVALSLLEELGARSTSTRARWAKVLANLQRGAFDEAERGLQPGAEDDETIALPMFDVCSRAEILLSRGDIDGGLRLWRQAAEHLRTTSGTGLWKWEVQAVAVVTHARHGRSDLVAHIVETLPGPLSTMVDSAPVVEFPACGSLLVALAVSDLDRGDTASGARLIALAERFGLQRSFQPAMSITRLRDVAEQADPAAYAEAVSTYADLDHDGLRAAASAELGARDQLGSRLNSARAQK
ncbi:ATP-binding protein [Amycolatopsis sp. RTGN1]|uniref:ATP-binding protein n=1 Tax=Amycolatopsis ponsaeliensis TaxID=2992142 RepID=UPI00254CA216|nr:BTAD domain-containing putative transcriptional regulator [Amycolatopsis sp. RTGN1]